MCKNQISLQELSVAEIPVFLESLGNEERIGLIIGDSRFFDEPLKEAIESLSGEEKMEFIRQVVSPLDKNERKQLFEIEAFDVLSEDEFEEFRRICLL